MGQLILAPHGPLQLRATQLPALNLCIKVKQRQCELDGGNDEGLLEERILHASFERKNKEGSLQQGEGVRQVEGQAGGGTGAVRSTEAVVRRWQN